MAGLVTENAVETVAALLRQAVESKKPVAPVRDHFEPGDIASAYAVQAANTRFWTAAGRRLVGRKVGLTSAAVQKQLGVDQPDFGALMADMAVLDGEEVSIARLLQPRAEAEIALVLEKDLPEPDLTPTELMTSVRSAVAAIEIVDSRIADWDISITDTIADNASSGLFVLGNRPRRLSEVDLRLCGMTLERNGRPVSFGSGAACMGNPLNAAVWLARTLAKAEIPLKAGDVVMTGALGPLVPVRAGDAFEAHVGGFGSVHVGFTED